MSTNLNQFPEPDWSNSKTGELELWKNPMYSKNERLNMADGAVSWRDAIIKNLRSKLAAYAPNADTLNVSLAYQLLEKLAESIYETFECSEPVKPKWVAGGNSHMQDKARDAARKVLNSLYADKPENLADEMQQTLERGLKNTSTGAIEKLAEQVKDLGITKLNVFPGTNPDVTPDQVAAEVSKSLDRITAGDFEDVTNETEISDEEMTFMDKALDVWFTPEMSDPALVGEEAASRMRDLVSTFKKMKIAEWKVQKGLLPPFPHYAPGPDRLPVEQEPKYGVRDGLIYNRASGQVIPVDEPIFIFRARDSLAMQGLQEYMHLLGPGDHRYAVEARVKDFQRFKIDHPKRMKYPDTQMTEPN